MDKTEAKEGSATPKKLKDLPEILQEILCDRGLCDEALAQDFLNPSYESLHDPFLFNDMQKATERILQALEKEERVVIYSDFDADGIPGGIILKETFERLGFENFENYIPHRNKEGYGLHTEAIERFSKEGVSLIITVDVGISATNAAQKAKELGIDLIITDHHEALQLPEAFAIINPKVEKEKYPFKELCGASVAWKLAQALLKEGKARGLKNFSAIPDGWEKWLLGLAALSTIGDMMPLVGENRVIVRFGLIALQKSPRPGLRAFLKHERISQAWIDEADIAFSVVPKINAASRLGDPSVAFSLLSETNLSQIQKDLHELVRLNKLRKTESAKITREAKNRLKNKAEDLEVLFAGDKSWSPALLGLSAGKLADEFGKMVCLWGQDETGVFKGSCRNGGKGHVAILLESVKEELLDFGGHEGAGGFSLDFEKLLLFEDSLNRAFKELDFSDSHKDQKLYKLRSADVNWSFYQELRELAPFGIANPAPEFLFENVEILSWRHFGKGKEHLEINFKSAHSEKSAKAIAFFAEDGIEVKNIKSIAGYIEKSSFGGRLDLRVKVNRFIF